MPRTARPVLTKRDFVRRYAAGEFGNASPTWDTYQQWVDDRGERYGQLFHIRNRIAGGATWYDVPSRMLRTTWNMVCRRVCGHNLYISAMAPTHLTILQGEVQEGVWGLDLFYTRVRKPMRDALREDSYQVSGLRAKLLLRGALDERSWEWLRYLLDAYPGHVVEFSAYGTCWGTVPGYNTLFWEVRQY